MHAAGVLHVVVQRKFHVEGGESSRVTGSPRRPRCVMDEAARASGGSTPVPCDVIHRTNTTGPVSEHLGRTHNRQSVLPPKDLFAR